MNGPATPFVRNHLSLPALLAVGAAIFGMHFGASSLLWPATWGRDSGTAWLSAFGGYSFTGLILPAIGYLAVVRGGSLLVLASQVGRRFALVFGSIIFFVVGPLFAIPRMSAAAWDAVTRALFPFLHGTGFELPQWGIVPFCAVFYLVIYWFISNRGQIVNKLSSFTIPALFLLEAFLILSVVVDPVGEAVAPNYSRAPFGFGFVSGYQTMDLPASLIFSGLILADIRGRGVTDKHAMMRTLFKAMCVGFVIFGTCTLGEMYRGSTASGTFTDVSYANLSVDIVMLQWGAGGVSVFNVALLLACIPSTVGLTASTADFMQTATNGRIGYKAGCLFTIGLSCLVSLVGLESIIAVVTPFLNFIYPPCIALALFMAFAPKQRAMLRGACWFCVGFGILEATHGYLAMLGGPNWLDPVLAVIPLAADGLGFISFLVIGAVAGQIFLREKKSL